MRTYRPGVSHLTANWVYWLTTPQPAANAGPQATALRRLGPLHFELEGNKTYHGYGGAHRGDDDNDDHDGGDHEFDHISDANLVVADAELGRSEWAKSTMIRLILPDELGASGSDHRSLHTAHAACCLRGLVCDGR